MAFWNEISKFRGLIVNFREMKLYVHNPIFLKQDNIVFFGLLYHGFGKPLFAEKTKIFLSLVAAPTNFFGFFFEGIINIQANG